MESHLGSSPTLTETITGSAPVEENFLGPDWDRTSSISPKKMVYLIGKSTKIQIKSLMRRRCDSTISGRLTIFPTFFLSNLRFTLGLNKTHRLPK